MMGIAAKTILVVTLSVVAITFSCVSGLTFRLWPTSIGDTTLKVTPQVIEQLQELKAKRKFLPDQANFYPGASNEAIRSEAQLRIDTLIGKLIADLPAHPKRSVVLGDYKAILPAFDGFDSEEKDEVVVYLERIMSIVGIYNSGELLNVWRYGVPYGWFSQL